MNINLLRTSLKLSIMKSIDNLFKDSGVDQEYYRLELARQMKQLEELQKAGKVETEDELMAHFMKDFEEDSAANKVEVSNEDCAVASEPGSYAFTSNFMSYRLDK